MAKHDGKKDHHKMAVKAPMASHKHGHKDEKMAGSEKEAHKDKKK